MASLGLGPHHRPGGITEEQERLNRTATDRARAGLPYTDPRGHSFGAVGGVTNFSGTPADLLRKRKMIQNQPPPAGHRLRY